MCHRIDVLVGSFQVHSGAFHEGAKLNIAWAAAWHGAGQDPAIDAVLPQGGVDIDTISVQSTPPVFVAVIPC